jgi:hypothetical protein
MPCSRFQRLLKLYTKHGVLTKNSSKFCLDIQSALSLAQTPLLKLHTQGKPSQRVKPQKAFQVVFPLQGLLQPGRRYRCRRYTYRLACCSSFDATARIGRNNKSLEKDKEYQNGQDGNDRACRHQTPIFSKRTRKISNT